MHTSLISVLHLLPVDIVSEVLFDSFPSVVLQNLDLCLNNIFNALSIVDSIPVSDEFTPPYSNLT